MAVTKRKELVLNCATVYRALPFETQLCNLIFKGNKEVDEHCMSIKNKLINKLFTKRKVVTK